MTYQFINEATVDIYVDENKVSMRNPNKTRQLTARIDQSLQSCFPVGAHVPYYYRPRCYF